MRRLSRVPCEAKTNAVQVEGKLQVQEKDVCKPDWIQRVMQVNKAHLVVLVGAVREVEAGNAHTSAQQLLQNRDIAGLGAKGAHHLE